MREQDTQEKPKGATGAGTPEDPFFDTTIKLQPLASGNAFFVLAKVTRALRKVGAPASVLTQFHTTVSGRPYEGVLTEARRWVRVA